MKILLDIGHPKDVNVFKDVIAELQDKGHEVKVFARAKENTRRMLEDLEIDYHLCPYYSNIGGKAFGIVVNDFRLYKFASKFRPDIFVSPGSPYSAHVSRLFRKPHIAFPDTEIAGLVMKLTFPFTDKIYTSTSFYVDLGPKQVRFEGYYELAYLHPDHFTPDRTVIEKYGLEGDYIVLRLSALASHHDIGAHGFSFGSEEELRDFISRLKGHGRVIIFSETDHWPLIEEHKLEIDPAHLHHILHFAKLYIGEGATMASESAILGVPSIYVSNTRRGYLDELETKYDLCYTIVDKDEAIAKAEMLLQDKELNAKWRVKAQKLYDSATDIVKFIVDSIEENIIKERF
jgi:predicted glycosyltransferase